MTLVQIPLNCCLVVTVQIPIELLRFFSGSLISP